LCSSPTAEVRQRKASCAGNSSRWCTLGRESGTEQLLRKPSSPPGRWLIPSSSSSRGCMRAPYGMALCPLSSRRTCGGGDPRYGVAPRRASHVVFFLAALLVTGRSGSWASSPASGQSVHHYGYVPEPTCMVSGVPKLPLPAIASRPILGRVSARERCYWRMNGRARRLQGPPVESDTTQLQHRAQLITRVIRPVEWLAQAAAWMPRHRSLAPHCARCQSIQALHRGYTAHSLADERADAERWARVRRAVACTPWNSDLDSWAILRGDLDATIPSATAQEFSIAALARLRENRCAGNLLFGPRRRGTVFGLRWCAGGFAAHFVVHGLAKGLRGISEKKLPAGFPAPLVSHPRSHGRWPEPVSGLSSGSLVAIGSPVTPGPRGCSIDSDRWSTCPRGRVRI